MTKVFNDYKAGDLVRIKQEVIEDVLRSDRHRTNVPHYGYATIDKWFLSRLLKEKIPNEFRIRELYGRDGNSYGGHWWVLEDLNGVIFGPNSATPSSIFELYEDEFDGLDLTLDI